MAVNVPLATDVQKFGGIPLSVNENVPDAEFAELNVPETDSLIGKALVTIENELPSIGMLKIVVPEGTPEQLPLKVRLIVRLTIVFPLTLKVTAFP